MEYYRLWYRLDKIDKYLIWIRDELDALFLEAETIPAFSSQTSLYTFASQHQIDIVDEEPLLHDLDKVQVWLQSIDSEIDCFVFLAAWNLFTDVSYTANAPFLGQKKDKLRNRIYDKLFFGNNLPYFSRPEGPYVPEWTRPERKKIEEIMTDGLMLFRSNVLDTTDKVPKKSKRQLP